MAESRMGEEEAYCNQKWEEMIKEVRKNVSVTAVTIDVLSESSVLCTTGLFQTTE